MAAPTVTGLSPTDGPTAGGTEVTITGTDFTGATAVDFGTTPAASFTINSATSITAESPSGTGAVDVTVVTTGGTSATSDADQFTYAAAPAVTGISPTAGPPVGGTTVTITGTGFTGATAVDFGTTGATSFTVVSATEITAVSPAELAGTVDIRVTTTDGTSATGSPDQFTYYSVPTSFVVTDGSDTAGSSEDVTLPYAITEALLGNHDATITFDPTLAGTTIALTSDDASGDDGFGPTAFVIDDAGVTITIDGSAAPGLVLSGDGARRVFAVTSTAGLTLEDLTLSGGLAQGGTGGESLAKGVGGGGGGAGLGGAIYDDSGTFTAEGVTFTNNTAEGGAGGTGDGGVDPAGHGGAGGTNSGGIAGSEDVSGGNGGFGGGGGGGSDYYGSGYPGGAGGFGGGGGGGGTGATEESAANGGAGGFGGGMGGRGGSYDGSGGASFGGGGGGGTGLGGGIFSNGGSITLVDDTFTGNSAIGGLAGGGPNAAGIGYGYGGAVFVRNGSLSATFDTFSGDTVTNGDSTAGTASEVYVLGDGNGSAFPVSLVDDILGQSGVSSVSDFGAAAIHGGTMPDFTQSTNDLVTNNPTDGSGLPGDCIVATGNPMLGALASNGGPTQTMALHYGSPAIGVGIAADFPGTETLITTDQTGADLNNPPDLGSIAYIAAVPTVSGLSPTEGPATGGTAVTITGTNLENATAVDFGTTEVTSFTSDTADQIVLLSPAGEAGTVDVKVITVGGTSATSDADQFTYLPPVVAISGGPLALGSTEAGTAGSPQSYTVSGNYLTNDLIITAPVGVELSDDGGTDWSPSLDIAPDGDFVGDTTIEARISASAAVGSISGDITNTSAGATEQDVVVSGTVQSVSTGGTVVASSPQTFYGQDVTLTANFSATANGSAPMTGTVSFYDGSTFLGTAPLVANGTSALPSGNSSPAVPPGAVSGQASLATSDLSIGGHIITAVYSGDANYASATSETPVSVSVAPATSSTTLTAATTAAGTTLTANVVVTSPGNPPVVGTVAFYDGTTLLGTEPVVDGVATLNATSMAAGMHSFTAVFTGEGTTSSSQTSLVISTANPTVTRVVRYGFHHQSTYLVLTFSTALDPASAEDLANYSLVGPTRRRGMHSYAVGIDSAVYDAATGTVTLQLAGRWNIHWQWRLTVDGSSPGGVKGVSGAMLDGSAHAGSASDTVAGSDYVATISMNNLAGRASKLPTLGLIDSIREARTRAEEAVARGRLTMHRTAVDHLIERGLLHVPGRHAKD
ncbi:MAG: beta strand repeat-containing protein [Isosphaeraceae bacterium]